MIGWIILALIAAFVLVLLVRAAQFRPQDPDYGPKADVTINAEQAVDHLAQMVRIPTVSNEDPAKMDEGIFQSFRDLLPQLYPHVFQTCTYERVDHTGLLFTWKGRSSDQPTVLMAHYDVVPVVADQWQHPPFCGQVFDGALWGRGTLDTKITLMGILESAEALIQQGFVPQHDVYFSFGGDEEVNGPAAPAAVALLRSRGIQPAFVVDEGGAVVQGVFPGVSHS